MIKQPRVPVLIQPRLIDYALNELQRHLTDRLSWLDHAFGKASAHVEEKNRRSVTSPVVYQGGKEYLKVFPDKHIGNFSFFSIEDGEELDHMGPAPITLTAKFRLIFWFDFRTVYPADWEQRTVENVKADVIDAMRSARLSKSKVRLMKAYHEAPNIYRGFTNTEIEEQFLMRPFGGFRLDGTITYREQINC